MDYLVHYGMRGQKWGVRRFQNEDGTLTPAGKERYGKGVTNSRYTDEYKDFLETSVTPYVPGLMDSLEDAEDDEAGTISYMLGMYFAGYDDELSQEQQDTMIQNALANLSYGMNAMKNPKVESALHKKIKEASALVSGGLDTVEKKVGSVLGRFRKEKEPEIISVHKRKPKAREKNVGERTGEIKVRKPTKEERKKIGNKPAAVF